ncbi:MAG: hypothetical protein BWY80_00097 [Firmicutes bacterium ADurb.Bin456]|nr:MAG: hypothetical protein BWY80_00097 [Firmicutes bacterium ADurb.Bin456]
MRPGRFVFPLLPALLFYVLAFLPAALTAEAGATAYQVIRAPVVKDDAVYELGVVFARFTAAQLQQKDVVTFRLPSDFIWTTAPERAGEAVAAAAAQSTGQWNEITATENYVRYGTSNYVEVPRTYSGIDNGLFQGAEPVLGFTRLSGNEVRMEITGDLDPGKECCFYLFCKRVYVPGGYAGEISVLFEAPSHSGFAGGKTAPGRVSGGGSPGEDEPANGGIPADKIPPDVLPPGEDVPLAPEYKTVARFVIGEKKCVLNGAEVDLDVIPYLKDGRTYLPVRYAVQALGVGDGGITWDGTVGEGVVTISVGGRILKLLMGSKVMYAGNLPIAMDVAPELAEPGRIMLPLRWVAEALGAKVEWDPAGQTITILEEIRGPVKN